MDATSSRRSEREVRCHCGSLMARVTAQGVELKCRRCKRIVLVATRGAKSDWLAVPLHKGDPIAS